MKQGLKKATSMVLVLLLLLPLFLTAGYAESQTDSAKRWNIMLVVDGSGSLFSGPTTDPDGLRYEAIANLLSILQDDGHYVGAMVFSANSRQDSSDESMRNGIRMNTGMIYFGDKWPEGNGADPKDYIISELTDAPLDYGAGGTTDIGTALLVAAETLKETQEENGLDSMVFLFTDGVTDLNYTSTYEKSIQNLHEAEQMMVDNGIKLCGVFLNKDGQYKTREVRDIVCAANGFPSSTLDLGDYYIEIENSDSSVSAMTNFMNLLGFGDSEEYNVPGSIPFSIPGTGAEEANLRIYSTDGKDLPEGMSVRIISPSGKEYSGAILEGIGRSGRTFRTYKLVSPEPGEWMAVIDADENGTVHTVCSLVYAVNADAELVVEPDAEKLHSNMEIKVTAYLSTNGVRATEPADYAGYSCSFVLENKETGEEYSYELSQNNSGPFDGRIDLDMYGTYEAYVRFECGSIKIESEPEVWDLTNHAPNVRSDTLYIKYGLFMNKYFYYDLSDRISDLEDLFSELYIEIQCEDCYAPAVSFSESGELRIESGAVGDGRLILTVTDSQGASYTANFLVRTQNITLWLILTVVVIAAAAFALLVILMRSRPRLEGKFTLSFSVKNSSNLSENLQLPLPLPGLDCKNNETLYKMVKIQDGKEYLRDICRRTDVREEDARAYLEDNAKLFKQVKFSVKSGRDEFGKVALLVMDYDREKTEMLRDSKAIVSPSGEKFTISYQAPRREKDRGFDDNFGEKKKKRKDPRDSF